MTLSKKIAAEVDSLDAFLNTPPVVISAQQGLTRVTLELAAFAPFGVVFNELKFDTSQVPSSRKLGDLADQLTRRITYLMEPLRVLEVDEDAGELEIRSSPPSQREQVRYYYELRLSCTGSLSLQRIAFDEIARLKKSVPCQLTREALERLIDDIVDVIELPTR